MHKKMNLPEIKMVNIDEIHKNPNNPRIIRDKNFKDLVKSIKSFPEMLSLRTVVVDENMEILGGNQRYEACKSLKYKQIPIMIANDLTEEQKKEFAIKDNLQNGDWDWKKLTCDWDAIKLDDWGLELIKTDALDLDAETNENKKVKHTCPKCGFQWEK